MTRAMEAFVEALVEEVKDNLDLPDPNDYVKEENITSLVEDVLKDSDVLSDYVLGDDLSEEIAESDAIKELRSTVEDLTDELNSARETINELHTKIVTLHQSFCVFKAQTESKLWKLEQYANRKPMYQRVWEALRRIRS